MHSGSDPLPRTPVATWALVLCVIAWGLFPFRVVLHHFPWGADGLKWATRGAVWTENWPEWVFGSTHFIGYRPVTAASFTVNSLFGPLQPVSHRLTDLALHGLAAVAVSQLARRLISRHAVWMALATLLFLAHPVSEEVVPHVARRSYSMAVAFGGFGLIAWIDDRGVWGRAAALLCFAAGVLSNEITYVCLPMAALWTLSRHGPDWRSASKSIATLLFVLVPGVVARWVALGGAGGYSKPYFALVRGGRKRLVEVTEPNAGPIVNAAFDYLWFPVSTTGAEPWIVGGALGAFCIGAFYAWAALAEPIVERKNVAQWVPPALLIWMLGYAMLFALSKTWFWRQAYPMAVPLALLLTWVAHDTWRRAGTHALQMVWRAPPQLLMLVVLLGHSALLRGVAPGPIHTQRTGSAMVRSLHQTLAPVSGDAIVYTILPVRTALSRNVHEVLRALDPQVTWVPLAHGSPSPELAQITPEGLVVGPDAEVTTRMKRKQRAGRLFPWSSLRNSKKPVYVVVPDGPHRWTLHRVVP